MHEPAQHDCMATGPRGFPTVDAFGARLALIRWQMGWNQNEAAFACRLPQASWREWELSHREPRAFVAVAEKIAEATGIDDYWILTGHERHQAPGAARPRPKGPWGL